MIKTIILLLLVGGSIIWFAFRLQEGERGALNQELRIRQSQWLVEYALTNDERTRGLGQRMSLDPGRGMLFVFPEPGIYGFWMKDMQFPLDFIFITDERVESVLHNISEQDDRILYPNRPVEYILEVNAGEAGGIESGDRVYGLPKGK
jgi:uncharacterized membrane protein (UPF0127 family)